MTLLDLDLAVDRPWLLWLLPLTLLPLLFHGQTRLAYPALGLLPADWPSALLDALLRVAAAVAVAALLLGLAGLFRPAQTVERIGQGAQMVLLLDRSSSMDRPFAGAFTTRAGSQLTGVHRLTGSAGRNSKGSIARELLAEFAARRRQDLIGMLVFSTNPIQVLPLTGRQDIIQAAIEAGNVGRGLAKTDIGAGLLQALTFFAGQPYAGSRILMLVSDGGARLDPVTQDRIREQMKRHRVALYWIYIRTANSPGLAVELDDETAAQLAPEQLLHRFFEDLDMPYRSYSAEDPRALEQAIDDVNRLQKLPIRYQDVVPRRDLDRWCYALALALLPALALAKLLELSTWRTNAG